MALRQFRSDDTSPWTYGFGAATDGTYAPPSGTDAPIDSACTGTSGTTSLSATNSAFAAGQLILIHQTQGTGVGAWELNRVASYVAGTITTTFSLTNTYSAGAQVMVMSQFQIATISAGVTITPKAWNGSTGGLYGFFCTTTATIAGNVASSTTGFRGAPGVTGNPSSHNGIQGEGSPGGGGTSTAANGSGGGGGGLANSTGGGGSNGTAGTAGTGIGGTAGAAATTITGTSDLTSAVLGGAGGSGANATGSVQLSAAGGTGGGFVLIIARSIVTTGSVASNGQNGFTNTNPDGSGDCNGGAGAGGSILFKGQRVAIGTNCAAAGGTGGGAAIGDFRGPGGNGGSGRIHVDYSTTFSGSSTPTVDTRQDFGYNDGSPLLLGSY